MSASAPPRRDLPKAGKNRLHFDLAPPVHGDQQAKVARLISLGATRIDIGRGDVDWVVLADPDNNEFCVLTPDSETKSVARG
ncbi:MAG: VOC family protein [Pseudonocardiaceae bacterium]